MEINEDQYSFYAVLAFEDLESGERIFIDVDDVPVVIFKIGKDVYAINDRCSHDDGPLGEGELDGFEVICPRHGARFDVRNGKVLSLPAVEDIQHYPIRILDGQIEIGVRNSQ